MISIFASSHPATSLQNMSRALLDVHTLYIHIHILCYTQPTGECIAFAANGSDPTDDGSRWCTIVDTIHFAEGPTTEDCWAGVSETDVHRFFLVAVRIHTHMWS